MDPDIRVRSGLQCTEISVEITCIEHIYDPTANFRKSKMNLVMYLHWYNRLATAISTQLWKILSSSF